MLLTKIVFIFLNFILLSNVCSTVGSSIRNQQTSMFNGDEGLPLNSISYELRFLDIDRGVQTYEANLAGEDGSEQRVVLRRESHGNYQHKTMLEVEHDILRDLASDEGFQKEIIFNKNESQAMLILEKPRGIALDAFDLNDKSFWCPDQVIFAIGAELLKRLKFMHGKGILHRYINPGTVNIHGEAVLLSDFRWAAYMNVEHFVPAEDVATNDSLVQFKFVAALENQRQTVYDDLKSMFYTLLFFYYRGQLPWSKFDGDKEEILDWHRHIRSNNDTYFWSQQYFPDEIAKIVPLDFEDFARALSFEKNTEEPFNYDKWIHIFEKNVLGNKIDRFWDTSLIGGRYRVGEKWMDDNSTNCTLYKGEDTKGERDVMIKVQITKDELYPFLKFEMMAYRRLQAINNKTEGLGNIYAYTTYKEHSATVFELVHETLDHYIGDREISDEEINRIATQMIERAKYVHSRGIIHRNMNPRSFFVSNDILCLMDFEISYDLNYPDYYDLLNETAEGFKMNPAFKSVYVLGNAHPTERDDMIAIGYVLLYIKNGRQLPWIGYTHPKIIASQRKLMKKLERADSKYLHPIFAYLKYVTNEDKIDYEKAIKCFSSRGQ